MKKRFRLCIIFLLLASVLLSGCGSSEGAKTASSANGQTSAAPSGKSSAASDTSAAATTSAKKKDGATVLRFKDAASYASLKELDGEEVSISGYMATSSPVDGSFIFLMNLPYQSCPFCKPNTSQLSNTMEVYPKKGKTFSYTTQAIRVTGTLEVAESEEATFTDSYGYEFNFKIVDASYTIIQAEELSESYKIWQEVADSDIITDLYSMYDYLNFVCYWPTYYCYPSMDESGQEIPGYYLWPGDAENFIYTEGAQYNYGYQEGYFDELISRVEAFGLADMEPLAENIRAAQALAEKALAELEAEHYSSEYQHLDQFDTDDYVYTLDKGEELSAENEALYYAFAQWLAEWLDQWEM